MAGDTCTAERHGTVTAYNKYGCRCETARRAATRKCKHRKVRLLAEGLDRFTVPPTGVARRLQALAVNGWSVRMLAAELGGSWSQVWKWQTASHLVHVDTLASVAAMYERLRDVTPPAQRLTRTRNAALANGWVGPDAWDDDTIDDPNAVPVKPCARGSNRLFHVEDLEWLVDAGESWTGLVARLGVEKDSMAQTLRRRGRRDLLERLARREVA